MDKFPKMLGYINIILNTSLHIKSPTSVFVCRMTEGEQ